MIRVVLFDYGGVIADDTVGGTPSERLSSRLGIDDTAAWDMFSPVWHKLTRGKISDEEAWKELEKKCGKPIPANIKDIVNTWESMPVLPEVLRFVKELKAGGYRTGMLSTTLASTAAEIREHGGYNLFDPVILSCEVGYAKPDPEIYEITMDRLPGVKPSEVIFLDDRDMCLPPANALGMHTVCVENPSQAIAATKAIIKASLQE